MSPPVIAWPRASAKTYHQARPGNAVILDVNALATDDQPPLSPARAWAVSNLHHQRKGRRLRLTLTESALNHLAEICEVEPAELKALLVNPHDKGEHGD